MVKKHQKPRKTGEKGQVIEMAMPIHASNVALTDASEKTKTEMKAKAVKAPKVVKAKAVKK